MARRRLLSQVPPVTLWLMIATAVATIGCVVARNLGLPELFEAFILEPHRVIPGLRVWKLLSYVFITGTDPLGFLFDLLMLYFFGGWFERAFGPRRFLRFFAFSAAGAALLPVVLGLFFESVAFSQFYGAWSVFEALTVAMGVLQPSAQIYFYMIIPVTARQLMFLSWGLLGLFIVFGHQLVPYLPPLGGIGMGFLLTLSAQGPRRWWLRLQAARMERKLKRRAQHLRVVPPAARDDDKDKKTYLH